MVTSRGWWALGAGTGLLLLGSWLGYPEVAAGAVAILLALAMALVWIVFRPDLTVQRRVDPVRVTVEDEAACWLSVSNTSNRQSLPIVATDRVGSSGVEVAIPRLAAGASTEVVHQLPTGRRAVLDVGPLQVTRSDPFGFVRIAQGHGSSIRFYVHPRYHLLNPLPATLERSLEGPTSDTAPKGSQAFHTLREYVPGDDRRMIHWRSSARTGTLMVKQHVDTSLPDLTVVLDTRREHLDDVLFEEAVEAAASLVVACAKRSFPIRMRTTDGQLWEPHSGQHPVTYFLDRLAGVERVPHGDLVALAQLLQGGRGGFALVVLTSAPTGDDLRSLTPLRRNYDSVTAVDFNAGDGQPAVAPGVQCLDATSAPEFAEHWNRGVVR